MVATNIDNDNVAMLASSKILYALQDIASINGHRNRWKALIEHLSVRDLLNGSMEYDSLTITLINYLISGIGSIELRTDHRRMLNALQFDKLLQKLEDRVRRGSMRSMEHIAMVQSLKNQIQAYR